MFKNIAIIASMKDTAGLNIKKQLLRIYPFEKTESYFDADSIYKLKNSRLNIRLFTISKDSINAENLDKIIDAELFAFITKHKSKSEIPSLCIHTQGNIGRADYGGKPKNVSIAPACYLKTGLKNLHKLNSINFDVVQEVTHHGPHMEKPSFFIEVGATEKEWKNEQAASIVATALMKTLFNVKSCISAIGIGGPHTTTNFKKIILNTNIGLGHVCAHYNLPDLDYDMLNQMFIKTIPKPSLIILDWKGLKHEKERIKGIVEKFSQEHDIKVLKTKNFKSNKKLK